MCYILFLQQYCNGSTAFCRHSLATWFSLQGNSNKFTSKNPKKCSWPCFKKHISSQGLRCFSVLQPFCMCTCQAVFQLVQTSRTPCERRSHPTVVAVFASVSHPHPSPQTLQVCSLRQQQQPKGVRIFIPTGQYTSAQLRADWVILVCHRCCTGEFVYFAI